MPKYDSINFAVGGHRAAEKSYKKRFIRKQKKLLTGDEACGNIHKLSLKQTAKHLDK